MINCLQKKNQQAKKYFTYRDLHYPICCTGCIKSLVKKINSGKEIESFSLKKLTDENLFLVDKKITKDRIKQALMEEKNIKNKKRKLSVKKKK